MITIEKEDFNDAQNLNTSIMEYTNFKIAIQRKISKNGGKKEDKMPFYREDLHVKVVEFLKKEHTIKETAETFGVSMKSVSIWKKMDKGGKGWYLILFRGVRIE